MPIFKVKTFRELKEKADAKRRAAQAENEESSEDENEVIPLNQVKMDDEVEMDLPDLEKVPGFLAVTF